MTQSAEMLNAWVLFLRNKLGDHLPDQDVARDRIGKGQLLDMLEELEAAREELAELRDTAYRVSAIWRDGDVEPHDYALVVAGGDDDGEFVDLAVDASCVVQASLRRQAREWCRSVSGGEGPALEQLLSLVPERYRLALGCKHEGYDAWWHLGQAGIVAAGQGPTRVAAIQAATRKLLGLDGVAAAHRQLSGSPARLIHAAFDVVDDWAGEQLSCPDCGQQQPWCCVGQTERPLCLCTPTPVEEPRQTCGSCEHWRRDDEPATEAGARPCGLDEEHNPAPRHPQSSCGFPGFYRALGTAKTDPAPDSDSDYPSSDRALAAKIAELQTVVATGDSHFPDATRRYLDELLAEQRRRLDSPPLKGVSQPAANIIRSEGGES